jgi:hypothetical protein
MLELDLDSRTFTHHIEPQMDRLLSGMLKVGLKACADNPRATKKQTAVLLDIMEIGG